MQIETIGLIFTLCVFAGLGWFLARAFSMPVRIHTWVLLVVTAVGGAFVGVNTSLLSVFGLGIRLNVAIVSCAIGVLIALMVRTGRQQRTFCGT
jgi:hypothetical protein